MSGYDDVASAIVAGQMKVVGPLAVMIANRVDGLAVGDDGSATVGAGDPVAAIEALVREYSALSGQLGVRLCRDAASAQLAAHPEVVIPVFQSL